ncbi:hypothetical protein TVAG_490270 [Trichomonas vaginalis G3]|uniref:Uncharacterized protein n=1 Tax=Trichomonas vaginalis (strain ATCC PRA-98 / G3) TaxID=412133 RepID=A2F0W4_TRIV3|nr:hypothetical protein TVAGG3_0532790 [Trichomonas vaginalis G3]EAY01439.1 hypothetical protein TVAG_490270 [Trichomonas vaginalis G3]KAI5519274.1 hypothetical protein TVAGG3_0532790 [Trichomonas vaginalis G3]|eukprot:XP_001314143.1 hypothetical protein [Trichomonas vaginalis G3]
MSSEMCSLAQQILESVTPFYEDLIKTGNLCSQAFETLVQISKKIISFETKFVKSSVQSLNSIVDLFNSEPELRDLYKILDENIPTPADFQKIAKSKSHKPFLDALSSKNVDLKFWFSFPYTYIATWTVFWKQILEIIPVDDSCYSIYQHCLLDLNKIEFESQHARIAQQFKDKLTKLFKLSDKQKVFIPKNSPLLWLVPGYHVCKPSNIKADLFIFEDRVVLCREDNLLISSKLLNTWIVKSPMHPAQLNIVDVLGTKQSFAFQPETENDAIALWKTWDSIATWCPSDWSMFQPIIIDPNEKDEIEWETVYK